VKLVQDDKVLSVKDAKGVYLTKVTAKNQDKITINIRVRRDGEDVVELRTTTDRLIGMDVDGGVYLANPADCSEVETEFRLERHRKGKKVAFVSVPYHYYLGVGGFLGRGTKLSGHKEMGHGELFEEQDAP